jgi:hypothetical protein
MGFRRYCLQGARTCGGAANINRVKKKSRPAVVDVPLGTEAQFVLALSYGLPYSYPSAWGAWCRGG